MEVLKKLMSPYLFGENEERLYEVLGQSVYEKNKKLVEIAKFKEYVKTYAI